MAILGRLGSEYDGERAAAALLATRLLKAGGLTWADLRIRFDSPEPVMPQWRIDLELCRRHIATLNEWGRSFVTTLSSQSSASPKQRDVLKAMADGLRELGCA